MPAGGVNPERGRLFGRAPCNRVRYICTVRPARRLVKTEIFLPKSPPGRAAVIGGLVVGGTVAVMMVALFTAFLFETVRRGV